MGAAGGGVNTSEGLPQCGVSPCPSPQLLRPHQTWPHCQAHFRDGWKFPFQQNPFVKPWSFGPRSAVLAWLWLPGAGRLALAYPDSPTLWPGPSSTLSPQQAELASGPGLPPATPLPMAAPPL